MRLPNFLVIGAQKSGTTWIHRFLLSRPDVFVPRQPKELMFFDLPDRFALGMAWYASHFAEAPDVPATGECTARYLYADPIPCNEFLSAMPSRVIDALGSDMRFIASLRNPIDRALSAFLHNRRMGRIPDGQTIGRWLNAYGIMGMGLYAAHLAAWAKVYPAERFFLVTYDDLFANPDKRRSMLRFIGAKPASAEKLVGQQFNEGIGFARTVDGAVDSTGALVASPAEIDALRTTYRPDVLRLADEWPVDVTPWRADFG